MRYDSHKSAQKTARLTNINNQQFIKLEAPYDKTFLNNLKASVPAGKRSYLANDKYWVLAYDQLHFLLHLCDKFFDDTLLFGFPEEVTGRDNCFGVLYVTSTAPKEIIKAAYKALAYIYHPDRPNGDNDKMIVLNQAYKKCLDVRAKKSTDWRF